MGIEETKLEVFQTNLVGLDREKNHGSHSNSSAYYCQDQGQVSWFPHDWHIAFLLCHTKKAIGALIAGNTIILSQCMKFSSRGQLDEILGEQLISRNDYTTTLKGTNFDE